MAYLTVDEFIARHKRAEDDLIDLTDRDGTGVIDREIIAQAVSEASEFIDGYLAGRVDLPLAEVPGNLKRICADIGLYLLYSGSPTDLVEKRFNDAKDYLQDIAAGRVGIGVTASGAEPQSAATVVMESDGRVFKRNGGFL